MKPFLFALALIPLPSLRLGELPAPLADTEIRPFLVSLSPDGKRLLVAGGSQKGADWKVFDLATGKCTVDGTKTELRGGTAHAGDFSRNGLLLAVAGNATTIFLLEADTGKLFWSVPLGKPSLAPVRSVRFTPDGKYLLAKGSYSVIRVWDLEKKDIHASFRFTSTNSSSDIWLKPYYFEPAKNIYQIKGTFESATFALSPDGKTLVLGGEIDGIVPIIDLASGRTVKTLHLKMESTGAASVCFTGDGKWVLFGGSRGDRVIEIWDIDKGQFVTSFGKHDAPFDVTISPDKKTAITSTLWDGFRVWDVATGKERFSYFTEKDRRMPRITPGARSDGGPDVQKAASSAGAAFFPDGKTFMIAPHFTYGKTEIYFHDTATGKAVDFREVVKRLPENNK